MKVFFILPLIFSALPAYSLDWKSSWHHIEPLMNLSEHSTKMSPDSCVEGPVKVATYISDQPKVESWRNHYKLPQLLTKDFYKVEDVCKAAKQSNEQLGLKKDYALIANKNHFCDLGHKACLSLLKSISDPCNHFVQDNFHLFHIRSSVGRFKPSGSKEVQEEYGAMGPSLLVIDLKTCSLMPTMDATKAITAGIPKKKAVAENYFYTPPSISGEKDEKGEFTFRSSDERIRFKALKTSLIKNIPSLKHLEDHPIDCYENGKRSLPGFKDDETIQYGEIKIPGFMGIRKLMDEQLIEVTGTNPYSDP